MKLLLIGSGGFAGAVLRYVLSKFFNERYAYLNYPVGTVIVNVAGTFLLCLLMGLSIKEFGISKNLTLFFCTGFLGSFTTFSTFIFENISLTQNSAYTGVLIYFCLSIIGSFMAGILALSFVKVL